MIWEKNWLHLEIIFPDSWFIFHKFFVFAAIKLPNFSQEIFIDTLVPGSYRFVGLAGHGAHWVGYLALFFAQLTLDICFEFYRIFIELFFCKFCAFGHKWFVHHKSFKWRGVENNRCNFFNSFCLLLFLDFCQRLFLRRWLFLENFGDLLDIWLWWLFFDLWFKIFNSADNLIALNADGFYFLLEFLNFLLDILYMLLVVLPVDNLAIILNTLFLDYLAITHLIFYIIFLLFYKSYRVEHMICWNDRGTRHYLSRVFLS